MKHVCWPAQNVWLSVTLMVTHIISVASRELLSLATSAYHNRTFSDEAFLEVLSALRHSYTIKTLGLQSLHKTNKTTEGLQKLPEQRSICHNILHTVRTWQT